MLVFRFFLRCSVLFSVLMGACWGNDAKASECDPVRVGSWAAKELQENLQPKKGWVSIDVPHALPALWPTWKGAVWYRLDWQLNCSEIREMPHGAKLALAISGIRQAGAVYWNDELLWSDLSLSEPYSRSWNMPRWWPVSVKDLSAVQTVWIRVVSERPESKGLGYVSLGDMNRIQEEYASRYWRQRISYVITASLSLTISGIALVVWLWRRSERVYLWIGLMQLCWTLYLSTILSLKPWLGIGSLDFSVLTLLFFVLYAHCFLIFVLRFCGQHLVILERVAWGGFAVCALLLGGSVGYVSHVGDLALIWGVALFNGSCLYAIYRALRSREPQHWLLGVACAAMVIVAVHDMVVALRHWDNDMTWSYFSWPLNMVMLAVLLGWQVASHMRRVDQFNSELTAHVAQAKAELAQVLEQQHSQDLKNAKLQERVQLAHDLHDGLGGSLVRSMALVEQSPQPLSNDRMMSLLKSLRDDLRQVIDSGSSSDAIVPETPARWIAPLRHRFMHILDEMNIQAQWQVDGQWQERPSPLQCMGMLRFLEEALTNVIKHSQARHIRVVSSQPDPWIWVLTVQDDGVGLDWEAVQQAGISVGMRSMQARLGRIGGELQVQSRPGCTLLVARVLLPAVKTEAP